MEIKHYCRLCLGRSDDLLWVFDQRFEANNHLKDLIFKTTGVEIGRGDTISQKICQKCGDNVVKLYEFRNQSLKNDQFLREQQKGQRKTPHQSILNIFQKYPRILIPDLEICLSANLNPVVEMKLDEVENHFKSKKDFQKQVIQVLRQERQKQRARNAALKSKNAISSNELVSPISIKFRQDKSGYEIVQKNDEVQAIPRLKPFENSRKRQLSECEQSFSYKKSLVSNNSSMPTPVPNRRQSIGPIEISLRPGPSDLDSTLLEALEVSENHNLPFTPAKRPPAIISNILIKPADLSNIKTKQLNPEIVTNNSIEQFNPKPSVINDLYILNREKQCSRLNNVITHPLPINTVSKHCIQNQSMLPSTVTKLHQRTENVVQNVSPVVPRILPKQCMQNPNFLSSTEIRPHHHSSENLVSNISHVSPCILPNPNLPPYVNRPTPIVQNINPVVPRPVPTSTVQQFTPIISLVSNTRPELSVTTLPMSVGTNKDPYIFEVDEYLNPIKDIPDLKSTIRSNYEKSTTEPISAKAFVTKQTNSKYNSKSEPKQFLPNRKPVTTKTVEKISDPYIFEVEEHLNPIKLNKSKLDVDKHSHPNPISTKVIAEAEYHCNFCRKLFSTTEKRKEHFKSCRIKKEIEAPSFVLLENIADNLDIRRKHHKAFIEIEKQAPIKVENLVIDLVPQVEIKNSNFPNINYASKTTDILKQVLAFDKNESPSEQNSQTDLSSESPELTNVISSLKMFPKKDSIRQLINSASMDYLKSFIHLYKLPVNINYKECFEVNYNFKEPPKRKGHFEDWNDLIPIDIVKTPMKKKSPTQITENIANSVNAPNSVEALAFPTKNICQKVSTTSITNQNIHPNSRMDDKLQHLRESVITSATSTEESTEGLVDLGGLELFTDDAINSEICASNDSGICDTGSNNQLYPSELVNNPQTNYGIQPQQNAMYQQCLTNIQPNVISTGTHQRIYPTVYPPTAGERINGLETNYFENYMNHQQSNLSNRRIFSTKPWHPIQVQQNPAYKGIREPPPSYASHFQINPSIEKLHISNAHMHPYNQINHYQPKQLVNNYPYKLISNQNVNVIRESNYYPQNCVPDVNNIPANMNSNCHSDNGSVQINSAIMQINDNVNNGSTIRVRPLSDLK